MGPILGQNRAKAKRGMPWLKTDAANYLAQLGFPDKGRAFKGWLSAI